MQFINTIKTLQVLDPSILSVDALSQPIREYLQAREDTVRCAVAMFTDENSELYQELMDSSSDENENSNSKDQWEPQAKNSLRSGIISIFQ